MSPEALSSLGLAEEGAVEKATEMVLEVCAPCSPVLNVALRLLSLFREVEQQLTVKSELWCNGLTW